MPQDDQNISPRANPAYQFQLENQTATPLDDQSFSPHVDAINTD